MVVTSAKKPTILVSATPLEFTVGTEYPNFVLPVQDLFPAAEPVSLRYRKLNSNEVYTVPCDRIALNYPATDKLNIGLTSLTDLTPGQYAIEIPRLSGSPVVAPQVLTVKKGIAKLSERAPFFALELVQKTATQLTGANLYAGEIELILRDIDGNEYRLKPTQNAQNGTTMTIETPDTIKPGYYRAQLVQNGQPVGTCNRVGVTRYANQPMIASLDYAANAQCAFTKTPLQYRRGQTYSMIVGLTWRATAEAVLTNVNDPTQNVTMAVNTNVVESYPKLYILTTAAPGTYRLTVRVTDEKGTVRESEPYEQLVQIQ